MAPSLKFLNVAAWGRAIDDSPDTRLIRWFRKASEALACISLAFVAIGFVNALSAHFWPEAYERFWIRTTPQRFSMLLCFFLTGLGVLSVRRFPLHTRWLQAALGAVVLGVAFVSVNADAPGPLRLDPYTGWIVLLMGFVAGAGGSRMAMVGYVRQFALFVIFFLCGLVLVGHLYELSSGTPYLSNYLVMTWASALTGLFISHSLLFQHPNFGIMRLISGEGVGCHIMRRLLPASILLLGVLGALLAYGENRGWYPPSFGESLYTVLAITGLSGILLFTAASLNRLDGERREREREIQRNQQQLQSVLDHTSSIVCLKDLSGRYLLVNKSFSGLFGKTPQECLGLVGADLYSADLARKVQAAFDRVIETRAPMEAIESNKGPDGTTSFMLASRFPLLDAEGNPYAVCGIYTDITGIKRQEEEIHRLNESLHEKTLRQEAANSELEAFSYSVSHDLRAPLRHIAGFGQLLAQRNGDKLDEKSRHYLDVIQVSVARMGALIDDLLSFSRASKVELSPKRVRTAELVAEVRAELEAQRKGPPVAWDIGDLPDMHGDPAMLRLVWVNLLSNAVKYSGKNPAPRISVGFGPVGEEPAAFFVRDNGAGFDMRYADKLFGVFQRLHSNQEYEGTGIGLAMVRRILERHGGRIRAEGVPGEGACFYLVVPGSSPEGGASGARERNAA